MDNPLLAAVITILVVIGVFLLIRMFWLWYWKIDVAIRLLTEIRDSLQEQGVSSVRRPRG